MKTVSAKQALKQAQNITDKLLKKYPHMRHRPIEEILDLEERERVLGMYEKFYPTRNNWWTAKKVISALKHHRLKFDNFEIIRVVGNWEQKRKQYVLRVRSTKANKRGTKKQR